MLEADALCKFLEKLDNKQNSFVEFHKNLLKTKEDEINRMAYREANRKAVALDQSDEKMRRGKMYWLEAKRHIFCEGSIWYPLSSTAKDRKKRKRRFWQIDVVEDRFAYFFFFFFYVLGCVLLCVLVFQVFSTNKTKNTWFAIFLKILV